MLLRQENWEPSLYPHPLYLYTCQPLLTDSSTQMLLNQPLPSFSPLPTCCPASIISPLLFQRTPLSPHALSLVALVYMATGGIISKHANETGYNMMTRGVPGTNGRQCIEPNPYFPLGKSQIKVHGHSPQHSPPEDLFGTYFLP